MYTLLILALLTTTTLPGILSATHPALSPVTGPPANSFRGATMDHQPRPDDGESVQKAVRRRSINIPDPEKPKVNRLLKVNRNRFLEVTQDGHVVTTTSSNSVYSKLEVQFMCQLFPEQFRPCSPSLANRRHLQRQMEAEAAVETEDQSQRSTYSAVLLRFTETSRYLCIDESANIYTKLDASGNKNSLNVSECIFQHDFLPNQYDVYSSHKYPRNSSRCLLDEPYTNITSDTGREPPSDKGKYCDMRWFIGVTRKAEVRTIKSSRAPSQKAFFIQRWVHDQPSQTSPQFNVNPHRESIQPGNSSSRSSSRSTTHPKADIPRRPVKNRSSSNQPHSIGPSRARSRRPMYRFLTRLSASLFRRRNRGSGYKKAGCGNLLKNCVEEEEEEEDEDRQTKLFARHLPQRKRERKRKTST